MLGGIEYQLDAAIVENELPRAYANGVSDALTEVRSAITTLEETISIQENLFAIEVVDNRVNGGDLVVMARPWRPVTYMSPSARPAQNPDKAGQDRATLRNLRLDQPGLDRRTRSIEITDPYPEKDGD
jgi:hypothetical protein